MVDSGKETRGPRAYLQRTFPEREGGTKRTKGSLSPRAVGYSAAGYFRVNRSSSGERVHAAVIAGLFLSFVDST